MTSISPWLEQAVRRVQSASIGAVAEELGRVRTVADGIATVSGLQSVRLDEVLRFQKGQLGFAQTLERDRINCVLLDDCDLIEAGDEVYGTGEVVRAPVGPGLLGRVVDPLGRPLDGGSSVEAVAHLPIDAPAPSIIERDLVTEPVQTGILAIDAMFALGRGQRELIIGDRGTGKTAIAADTVINQRGSDLICIYIAIGQKSSTVARVIEAIHRNGAPARCIFVVAAATASPGLQWIAPFAGMTMAEYFRNRGQHALVVIDDLTKHAATHREIALLTRQPPGREAYPADVFYLHARLLERAAKLSADQGGGSLTALPIAETDAGNLSAYIPTNLISITDGQLVTNVRLFQEGQKPAIDIGTSVSRVGGKTQARALRNATGSMRLDYAQFLELEMFSRFGGVPDAHVQARLDRGIRLRALLSQPQYAPLRLVDEVALAMALQGGALDSVAPDRISALREAVPAWLDEHADPVIRRLSAGGTLGAEETESLLATMRALAQRFVA
ncbi:MAG TPA: F0F1 ATP synthase subunit alpha [Rhodopila sp.]|uniref:F0F1 ATP synthase subunit alpha n=1 Tax=Rhodopila sp. TaxID=2480087 RepID=UPI002CA5B867|nr:F0F1 ATP synthase subunit alpha [Rhodopila sp.]HVY14107.1 F0F1 ATP synthase subunit alpha [Rhodopila sp.]